LPPSIPVRKAEETFTITPRVPVSKLMQSLKCYTAREANKTDRQTVLARWKSWSTRPRWRRVSADRSLQRHEPGESWLGGGAWGLPLVRRSAG